MTFTVGFVTGATPDKWARHWRERRSERLELVPVSQSEQELRVRDGSLDLCLVRLPIETDGLHCVRLYDEVPVVWMSKDHELSLLDEVSTPDLAEIRVIADAEPASVELATYSAAVLQVPMSIARSHSRRDLVYRPLVDAPPTTVALAWRTDNGNEWIDEFIGIVRGRSANSSRS